MRTLVAWLFLALPALGQVAAAPIWGVYVGNDITHTALPRYEAWLGRPAGAILAYTGAANWDDYDNSTAWEINLWKDVDRRVLWSIPLIPKGASLTDAAQGAYDSHWLKIAQQLARWHPEEPVLYIRTGWEFNGDWFPWSSLKNPAAFVGAWRHFVTTFRSVSGRFRFDWCPNDGSPNPEAAYPGDDYVDLIGLDVYEQNQWANIADPAERWKRCTLYGPHMLLWHQAFARSHHKPMTYPEWGTGGNGSGDDPLFVANMHQWFLDNHVVYASYWNSNADYKGQLDSGQYPQAAAKYRELFGK